MRFSIVAAALVAGVSASDYGYGNYTQPPTYTTEVVTEYTTYCPGPTEITHGGVTYTATSETTLTITNCPCTITYPVTSSTYAPPPTTYAPPPPATYSPPYVNTTSVYYPPTTVPSSPPVYTPTGSPVPTGAANKAVAASGAGLAAIFGLALAL